MKFEQIVSVLDVLTWVYRVYRVMPCGSSRETYLEIDVY